MDYIRKGFDFTTTPPPPLNTKPNIVCGPGTLLENGMCVVAPNDKSDGGGYV